MNHFRARVFGSVVLVSLFMTSISASGRSIGLSAPDGTPLAAMLYESSARPAPAVVLVHMLSRSSSDWTELADRLQEAGATVLAIDLRGHGRSGGSSAELQPMIGDVRAAIEWLMARPTTRPGDIAVVGGSLGANLAAIAAAGVPDVRAIALVSPSLDYRGIRLDPAVMKKIGARPVWMAASTQDPYALRTLKELTSLENSLGATTREQRLSGAAAHGTNLLAADGELTRALLDWLRRTLIF